MPRKRAFPPPDSGHFLRREIAELLAQERLAGDLAPRLVEHLSTLCPTCWASVRAASYDWDGPPTLDPALAALRRSAARDKAWLTLGGRHIEAIGEAPREPLGFGFLVIEEALAMAARPGFELTALTRALGLEGFFPDDDSAMSEREVTAARQPPQADLFSQYLAAAGMISLAQDDLENVGRFMGHLNRPQRMERLVIEESKIKILEVSARCGREIGEPELAYQDLVRAYHDSRDRGFRQLDFSLQLAEVLTERYREQADELSNLIARTAEVCRILLAAKSTEIVVYIAFRLARFLYTLDTGMRRHRRTDDDPPPAGPAGHTLTLIDAAPVELVRTAYEFLDAAGPYFESVADLAARTERYRYLFSFSLYVDADGTLAWARELKSAFEQLGPDHWHEALAMKGVIATLLRRHDPAAAAETAREFHQELTSWIPGDRLDAFFDRIAGLVPGGDLRDLLGDGDAPSSIS